MAREYGMIDPFNDRQMREGVISYGVSSYGYDLRVADEFKIFTNVNSAIVDPKKFDERSFIDVRADSLQRVVEGHFAGDRLSEARRGRIENRAVELVALDFIGDGRQLRHLGDKAVQRSLGLR